MIAELPTLQVVVVSTREGRKGPSVAEWFAEQVRQHGKFRAEIADLGVINLPMMDEPEHPRLRRYQHDHTKAWSSRIDRSHAFVFVTPEYNRSIPGVLKNAIDVGSRPYGKSSFLGKPIGIVGNSPGALGGVTAVKHLQNIMPGIAGPILGQPEIYLNGVGDAFDDKGQLTKEPVQKVLQQFIDAFAAFVEKQNK